MIEYLLFEHRENGNMLTIWQIDPVNMWSINTGNINGSEEDFVYVWFNEQGMKNLAAALPFNPLKDKIEQNIEDLTLELQEAQDNLYSWYNIHRLEGQIEVLRDLLK